MKVRVILFGIFGGTHLMASHFTPEFLAPVIAGTIYIPLMPFRIVGIPVYGSAESGGWASPSLLGWAIVFTFWTVVWWVFASVVLHLYYKRAGQA